MQRPDLDHHLSRSNDLIAWLFLVAVALTLQFFLSINTQFPYVVESGDNASILYIIAHWLDPLAFKDDVLLGVEGSTSFYQAAPMWLIYWLGLTGTQVGLFFNLLCFPIAMAQMSGFYILGKRLFAHRGVATALALISVPTVFTLSGDLWGLSHSPLLRSVYGAAFPWLLLLLIHPQGSRPYLLMFAAAVATYLHLPSGPPVAIILLVVSLLRGLSSQKFLSTVLVHTFAGLFYLALILPYAVLFSINYAAGDEQSLSVFANSPYTNVQLAIDQLSSMRGPNRMGILASRVPELSWAKHVVAQLFTVLYGVGSVVMIGLCVLWIAPNTWRSKLGLDDRENWLWIAAVFVGIVSFAVVISMLDQAVASAAGRAPLQVDFIRATRFLVPGSYIGVFFLIVWLSRHRAFVGVVSCIVVAASVWLFAYPSTSHGLYRFTMRQSIEDESLTQLGEFILHLPEKEKMSPVTPVLRYDYQSSALRYIGYLPLTFNRKDNNFISYSGKSDMVEHQKLMDEIDKIRRARLEPKIQAELIVAFDEMLNSQNVVIDRRVVRADAEAILVNEYGYKLTYENGLFALIHR